MDDLSYAHEFIPNRKGICKQIIGDKYCHQGLLAEIHQRWKPQPAAVSGEPKLSCKCGKPLEIVGLAGEPYYSHVSDGTVVYDHVAQPAPAQPVSAEAWLDTNYSYQPFRAFLVPMLEAFAAQQNAALREWKESAIKLLPLQEWGKELGLPLGESIHDKILPALQRLRAAEADAKALREELNHERADNMRLRASLKTANQKFMDEQDLRKAAEAELAKARQELADANTLIRFLRSDLSVWKGKRKLPSAEVLELLKKLVKLQESLLACYRLGKRPSDKLLDSFDPIRKKLAALQEGE